MRLGVTFAELLTDLRAEIGRTTDLGVGVSDAPRLKRALNRVYRTVYDEWDWPHLRRVFARKAMAAGERFYDLPDGLDVSRVESVVVWWNGSPTPIERGIGSAEYATFDSLGGTRSDPVLRWDVRYVDEPQPATMIEVWPVPASEGAALEFTGLLSCSELVNDADRCLLDAESILLYAAADILEGDAAKTKLRQAQARFSRIKGRQPDTERTRMGLGRADASVPMGRVVVRVSG